MKTVLEIKLGSCMTMRDSAFLKCMRDASAACDLIRNRCVRWWIRWREDNPDYVPAQRRTRDGSPKVTAAGNPVMEHPAWSQDAQNQMYHAGRAAAPWVSSNVASLCWSEVCGSLTNKMPYDHDGDARWVWQAVENHERNAASYRGRTIPVPNNYSAIVYGGCASRQLANGTARKAGKDGCVLQFPLYSKEAGRQHTSMVVRLLVSSLTPGRRKIIERIASGAHKMSDSQLVFKKGAWFLSLVYEFRQEKHAPIEGRMAVLTCNAAANRRPWLLSMDAGDGTARWGIGDGAVLETGHKKIEARRQTLRYRYKFGNGAGHGKSGFYKNLRPGQRKYRDLQDMFIKMAIADVIKGCRRFHQETLVYREPTKPLRDLVWFGSKSIPMDWTKFLAHLTHKCAQSGITLRVERMGVAEWKDINEKRDSA